MLIAFDTLFERLPNLRLAEILQYKDVDHFYGLEELRAQVPSPAPAGRVRGLAACGVFDVFGVLKLLLNLPT
jgi:hypothetical protein